MKGLSSSPLSTENAVKGGNTENENGDNPAEVPSYRGQDMFWKSKYFWIGLLAVVAVIAAIVGGIVAVTSKTKKSTPPSATPPPPTAPPTDVRTPSSNPRPTFPPTTKATERPWVQVGGDLVGESPGDEAGFSVSVSEDGSRAVVGARRNAKDGLKNRGAARIFRFDASAGFYGPVWDVYGEEAGDQCGFSVSMSKDGTRIAVGCLGSDKNGLNSGQVRIFDEHEGSNEWIEVSELLGEIEGCLFGSSVSLSEYGLSLAVGAPYYTEGTDMTRSGRAYVYTEIQESKWELFGWPIYGESSNDLFGWSVSLSADSRFVASGAPRLEGSSESGYVKVFVYDSDSWKLYGESMSDGVPGDRFGFSVSLGGGEDFRRVAIGAPGNNENGEGSGFACIYENGGSGWMQSGHDLLGDDWGDNLGYAVSMTPAADRMIVGVPNKKRDGLPVGQVKVIDVKNGTLTTVVEMYGRDGEKFGVSVSISHHGRLVFGGATAANLVRVYG